MIRHSQPPGRMPWRRPPINLRWKPVAAPSKVLRSGPVTDHGISREALDFVPLDPTTGKGRFDRGLAVEVAVAFLDAGQELAIPVKWGGMWHRFEDIPHIELINSGGRQR